MSISNVDTRGGKELNAKVNLPEELMQHQYDPYEHMETGGRLSFQDASNLLNTQIQGMSSVGLDDGPDGELNFN